MLAVLFVCSSFFDWLSEVLPLLGDNSRCVESETLFLITGLCRELSGVLSQLTKQLLEQNKKKCESRAQSDIIGTNEEFLMAPCLQFN